LPEIRKEKINEMILRILTNIEDKQLTLEDNVQEISTILESEMNVKLDGNVAKGFDLEEYLRV